MGGMRSSSKDAIGKEKKTYRDQSKNLKNKKILKRLIIIINIKKNVIIIL